LYLFTLCFPTHLPKPLSHSLHLIILALLNSVKSAWPIFASPLNHTLLCRYVQSSWRMQFKLEPLRGTIFGNQSLFDVNPPRKCGTILSCRITAIPITRPQPLLWSDLVLLFAFLQPLHSQERLLNKTSPSSYSLYLASDIQSISSSIHPYFFQSHHHNWVSSDVTQIMHTSNRCRDHRFLKLESGLSTSISCLTVLKAPSTAQGSGSISVSCGKVEQNADLGPASKSRQTLKHQRRFWW